MTNLHCLKEACASKLCYSDFYFNSSPFHLIRCMEMQVYLGGEKLKLLYLFGLTKGSENHKYLVKIFESKSPGTSRAVKIRCKQLCD